MELNTQLSEKQKEAIKGSLGPILGTGVLGSGIVGALGYLFLELSAVKDALTEARARIPLYIEEIIDNKQEIGDLDDRLRTLEIRIGTIETALPRELFLPPIRDNMTPIVPPLLDIPRRISNEGQTSPQDDPSEAEAEQGGSFEQHLFR